MTTKEFLYEWVKYLEGCKLKPDEPIDKLKVVKRAKKAYSELCQNDRHILKELLVSGLADFFQENIKFFGHTDLLTTILNIDKHKEWAIKFLIRILKNISYYFFLANIFRFDRAVYVKSEKSNSSSSSLADIGLRSTCLHSNISS